MRKKTIKSKLDINKIETKKKSQKGSMKLKSWFLKKISKINKPLARLAKRNRERAQINKTKN